MSSLLLNREVVNVDIEPTTFSANSLNPFGMSVGKLILEMDRDGFRLNNKKGKTVVNMPWTELEELKNEVREKGRFSFRGTISTNLTDATGLIRVGVSDPAERERLASIFDKLPPEMSGRKCSTCGGAIINNVCRSCGETFTGQQRRKGLKYIGLGVGLMLLGIVLTYSMYDESSSYMIVFLGPIVLGAGLIIGGLIALIFGKRV